MEPDSVLRIGREALMLVLLISVMPMAAALAVSLVIGVIQAATQIQEGSLPTVPRIIAVYAVIALAGYWMVQELSHFAVLMFTAIARVSG